jgi:putative intracellular protease/amidase
MSDARLRGKKVAVLVETEYVPGEIRAYRERFQKLGAEVHFVTRLWGQPRQRFVSDVDEPAETLEATRQRLEWMEVDVDLEQVDVASYDAVIMAANYTSVRLRYFEPPAGTPVEPMMVRSAPAVQFYARAMRNPRIVKGALCHGLWILTPSPELLAGRKVICHNVVLADVANAGASYTPSPTNVVVDGDLVTGQSWHDVEKFIDAIAGKMLELGGPSAAPPSDPVAEFAAEVHKRRSAAPAAAPAGSGFQPGPGPKRILLLLSEWGYWGEELIGPLDVFDAVGYTVDFATPTGQRPTALTASKDPSFVDPPLNRPVTSPEVARKVVAIDDLSENRSERSKRLDHPLSIKDLMPVRPYWAEPNFVRKMEAYNRALDAVQERLNAYDTMIIVGGSGAMLDLANNQQVHDIILSFYRMGKPIAAECYGVTCLAFAREVEYRQSILRGKRVTGHTLEYDYKDGTGFEGPHFVDGSKKGFGEGGYIDFGPPFYPLEFILRDATAPDGQYIGNFGKASSVIVDFPFITGRSTPDSYLTGQKLVEVLELGLRRYGW